MLCLWQGPVARLPWPRHEPPEIDLYLELWSSYARSTLASQTQLAFSKFIYIGDVPLWEITGPEMQVLTRDEQTVQYFAEFAAMAVPGRERVALRVTVTHPEDSQSPGFDSLLLYAVQDPGDAAARIAARPLLLSPKLLPPRNPKPVAPRVNPEPVEVASSGRGRGSDRTHPPSAAAATRVNPEPVDLASSGGRSTAATAIAGTGSHRKGIPDVKKAVQQTVLGALRLRGVKREDPDFKTMYHVILRATEFALRNRRREDLDVSDIHDKVEALLAIVE